jgi:hypothetical protein
MTAPLFRTASSWVDLFLCLNCYKIPVDTCSKDFNTMNSEFFLSLYSGSYIKIIMVIMIMIMT